MLRGFGREKSWVANGSWLHQKRSQVSSPARLRNRHHGLEGSVAGPRAAGGVGWVGGGGGGGGGGVCIRPVGLSRAAPHGPMYRARVELGVRWKTSWPSACRMNINDCKTGFSPSSVPLFLLRSLKMFSKSCSAYHLAKMY